MNQTLDTQSELSKKRPEHLSKDGLWRSFPKVPHLLQYVSNGNYYGRIKVGGKVIRESLKTGHRRFTKDMGFRGVKQAEALPRLHLGSSLVGGRGGDAERLVQRG